MKDRALARAGGPDDCDLLARRDAERHAVEHEHVRPRRIGEAHRLERDFAARWYWQSDGMRRRLDVRRNGKQFGEAFRSARCLRKLAPDFAQLAERTRGEYRIKDELSERTGCRAAAEYILRADPQDHDHAREHQEDDDRGQERARADRVPCGLEGAPDRVAEARLRDRLAGE